MTAGLLGVLLLAGCSEEPDESAESGTQPDLGLAECFAVQQRALLASPTTPEVAPARLDATAGVGFTRDAMCVDLTTEPLRPGWRLEETRIRVERANRQDAWAGAVFARVLPGVASLEGADSALPLLVPFDFVGRFAPGSECFRITIEATVSRGDVEGTWSTTGRRGVCPGTPFHRESLRDLTKPEE